MGVEFLNNNNKKGVFFLGLCFLVVASITIFLTSNKEIVPGSYSDCEGSYYPAYSGEIDVTESSPKEGSDEIVLVQHDLPHMWHIDSVKYIKNCKAGNRYDPWHVICPMFEECLNASAINSGEKALFNSDSAYSDYSGYLRGYVQPEKLTVRKCKTYWSDSSSLSGKPVSIIDERSTGKGPQYKVYHPSAEGYIWVFSFRVTERCEDKQI